MHQDHRPFGKHPKAQRQSERHPCPHSRIALPDPPQRRHPRQHADPQQRIKHRGRPIDQKHRKPGQYQRRAHPDAGGRPQPPCQNPGACDHHHCTGGAHQSAREFRHAGDQPDQIDQPEQQRRFVGIKLAIFGQVQHIARLPHL